jgi:hypothetical protein
VNWFNSFILWFNALSPLAFMVYVVSPPVLLAGLVASYFKWRDDHRHHDPHAAE